MYFHLDLIGTKRETVEAVKAPQRKYDVKPKKVYMQIIARLLYNVVLWDVSYRCRVAVLVFLCFGQVWVSYESGLFSLARGYLDA